LWKITALDLSVDFNKEQIPRSRLFWILQKSLAREVQRRSPQELQFYLLQLVPMNTEIL
jgi:hypothetical protein